MERRVFLQRSPAAAVGALLAHRWAAGSSDRRQAFRNLDPVDLPARIRLGQSALTGGLNTERKHLPYWNCGFKDGNLSGFSHSRYQGEGVWDRVHDVGRGAAWAVDGGSRHGRSSGSGYY